MKILYYTWFENSQEDMVETLIYLGHSIIKCSIPFEDYEQDANAMEQLSGVIRQYGCDAVFSFNFFPVIARTAENLQVKYISWIYDCPHWTLRSPAVRCACNYIFVFDEMQFLTLEQLKLPHLYRFPLAVNTTKLCEILGTPQAGNVGRMDDDISFVGSLYENNRYDKIQYLPEYLRGYLEGIMQAQELVYGYNFVADLLCDDVMKQLKALIFMDLPEGYLISSRELYAAMLNEKITSRDRIRFLNLLSEHNSLSLYSASDPKLVAGANYKGTVAYRQEMPKVFRRSKINLNITLRSIQSGIPLRALDIMGAGGFLLSNYQPELAEQFVDGKELVLFASAEELLDKVGYYLSHEEERCEIAYQGFLKVQSLFSYEIRVKQMMDLVEAG